VGLAPIPSAIIFQLDWSRIANRNNSVAEIIADCVREVAGFVSGALSDVGINAQRPAMILPDVVLQV
jgi:hypothetical protein